MLVGLGWAVSGLMIAAKSMPIDHLVGGGKEGPWHVEGLTETSV
jgi:hypothetical protein